MSNARAFLSLFRIKIIDGTLAGFVGVSLVFSHAVSDRRSISQIVICGIVGTLLFYIVHGLDDLVGYWTGVDFATSNRKNQIGEPKVLVNAEITPRQAIVAISFISCLSMAGLAWLIATSNLLFAIVMIGSILVAGQYSIGLRWRNKGIGELSNFVAFSSAVIAPAALLLGKLPSAVIVEGLLYGLSMVIVMMCSNLADESEDRMVGVRTLAVRMGLSTASKLVRILVGLLWMLQITHASFEPILFSSILGMPLHLSAIRCLKRLDFVSARRNAFRAGRLRAVSAALAMIGHYFIIRLA